MKIVKFLGGLGNQMFQYAFYLSLKQHFRKVKADVTAFDNYPLHNGFELEDIFDLRVRRATAFDLRLYTGERGDWITRKFRRLCRARNTWYQEEERHSYNEAIYTDKRSRYYWGYWQHYRYFSSIEPQLRKAFTFKKALDGENLELHNRIREANAISVHVRRGDYLDHPTLGGICTLDYYQKAIQTMRQLVKEPLFVIFSDDIPWCRQLLTLPVDFVFADWNSGKNGYIDMQLMSQCKHHIIANSSFSWWGAWLNDHDEKKVISPRKWVNVEGTDTSGIIFSNWITI